MIAALVRGNATGTTVVEPVRLQQGRSLITQPTCAEELPIDQVVIRGVAWSGTAPIGGVDVRIGDGSWQPARLVGERHRHRWQWWELITRLDQPGPTTLRARATDLAGRTQPDRPEWNRLGYGGHPRRPPASAVINRANRWRPHPTTTG